MSAVPALKLLALVTAMVAEYVAYSSPNPPPRKEETESFKAGDVFRRASWIVPLSALMSSWVVHGCEVAILLAQHASHSGVLGILLADPSSSSMFGVHPAFVLGFFLVLLGAALRKTCYDTLGRHFTFELAILKEHKLVTWGPYAVVRHPSYTGMFSAILGMLFMAFAPGSWIALSGALETRAGKAVIAMWLAWMVAVVLGTLGRVRREDAVLKAEFGRQWDEWARKTPYALVPYIY
ncbi:hypothetical protein BN946_scf184901.g2 [Trametes cinnabarina]|uniref:Protein-S-isoprenylcysteine O-methyltransferase n=1 Tax=Pycnoporus cinnabarinus TaxID=5643 RepID=A0A060SR87_PYCCI|nr:hypothetical protein BN946_scf184901.g2 [Trametes cinnabarina]